MSRVPAAAAVVVVVADVDFGGSSYAVMSTLFGHHYMLELIKPAHAVPVGVRCKRAVCFDGDKKVSPVVTEQVTHSN